MSTPNQGHYKTFSHKIYYKPMINKLASVSLFVLGSVEVGGALLILVLPHEFTKQFGFLLPWELSFSFWLGVIFGVSRLIAGYTVWYMKKWGIVLGTILSTETIIVVPSAFQTGLIGITGLFLAIIALISLLYSWFGNEVIDNEKNRH